jgi:hypothetical protein
MQKTRGAAASCAQKKRAAETARPRLANLLLRSVVTFLPLYVSTPLRYFFGRDSGGTIPLTR